MTENKSNIKRLIDIVEKLRSPEGCPWDKEQTHSSLKGNMIEEAYEAIDAIDSENAENLKEELGDVLLQVVLHAKIASEEGRFNIDDVAKVISDKLIRRHPHVFADVDVKNSDEVIVNWEKIKQQEKPERTSAISGVSKSKPALMAAYQLSKKAVKVGFEWPNIDSLWECLESEIEEFKQETKGSEINKMEDELGDILFSIVNVARWYKINPEAALAKANTKFTKRFQLMEEISSKSLQEYSQVELEELWKQAKIELKKIENS